MLRRQEVAVPGNEEVRINCPPHFDLPIVVCSDARDPLHPNDHPRVIRHATPLAPNTNGDYMPIRRSYSSTGSGAGATTIINVNDPNPFSVGDVIAMYSVTNGGAGPSIQIATTHSAGSTIAAVSYTGNILTLAGATIMNVTGAVIEVLENGHWQAITDPQDYDCCLLLDPSIQNAMDDGSATFRVQCHGAFGGSVRAADVNGPDEDGPDDLLEWAMRNMLFVAATKGS